MATTCPYCNIEVRESAIEAEDGCCPECGSIISASNSFAMLDGDYDDYEEKDIYDDFDDEDDDDNFRRDEYEDDIYDMDDEFEDEEFLDDDEFEDEEIWPETSSPSGVRLPWRDIAFFIYR